MKNIKNPEIFKRPFEEFRKGDQVKIKFDKKDKIYRIDSVNHDDSLAYLEGKVKPVDFSQLEFVSDELGDKLFEGAMDVAKDSAGSAKKGEKTKEEELMAA